MMIYGMRFLDQKDMENNKQYLEALYNIYIKEERQSNKRNEN